MCDLQHEPYLSMKNWLMEPMVSDPFHITFRPDQTFVMEIVVRYWKTFLLKTNFEILWKAYPCKLLGNFCAILSISGYKNRCDLSFTQDILVTYVVFEIC